MELEHPKRKRCRQEEFQETKDDHERDSDVEDQIYRHNGLRLDPDLYPRVPSHLFPDATLYGWTFTGSSDVDRVEYFQMELDHAIVNLDFYYTSGTVQTMKIDPTEGQVKLFGKGKQLLPSVYVKVLQRPLCHTDLRYGRRMG